MLYQVRSGDSPATIARNYSVTMDALIGANPQKPIVVVSGVRTWRDLRAGETLRVPVGGYVGYLGDVGTDAVNALMAAGGPCVQANAGLVCVAQAALGIAADGKWGSGTATAARALVPSAPAGCTPRPAWWAPAGQVNCPAVLPTPAPAPAPAPSPLPLPSPFTPISLNCPAGTILNPLTGSCDPLPTPPPLPFPLPPIPGVTPPAPLPAPPTTCPPGSLFNPISGQCEAIPTPPPLPPLPAPAPSMTCPAGQVFNALTGQCETPVVTCPPGQTLNPATGQCQAAVAPPPLPAPAPSPAPAPAPTPTQPVVTAPTTGGISTGTMVAGAVGEVALVGIIAAASMSGGKKSSKGRR